MDLRRSRRPLAALAVLAAFACPATARADAVTDWNVNANTAIFSAGPPAHAAMLSTAMVQGAVYDAVNAIEGGYQDYLPTPAADPTFSQNAAAATAAFRVVKALVPAQTPALQAQYDTSLLAIADGPAKAGGIAVGEAAAAAMLDARANDGRNGAFRFVPSMVPGAWRPSPSRFFQDGAAWVGNVTPFLVPDARMLRTDGPNPLWSRAYARDFNEVKAIGSLTSRRRTPDQTMAAIFWQAYPGGLYGDVMRSLSARHGLTTAQNARLFAMVSLAAADGAIGCWNDKARWSNWRPIDAIREAGTDGNRRTRADRDWRALFDPDTVTTPELTTPGFPDHPSGHSCGSSATLYAMRDFFGTDWMKLEITSPRFPTQPRRYKRFSQVLEEVVDARVWGGIHFRDADEDGAELGRKVARWERRHFFRRTR